MYEREDIMERFKEIISRLLTLCSTHEDIKAIIAFGSQCRAIKKADEYSDLDLIVVCDAPEKFLYQDDWLSTLGTIEYSFVESTIANQKERRVLYKGSLDVDFIVVTAEFLPIALENHRIDKLMVRGYRVLYDSAGFASLLEKTPLIDHAANTVLSEFDFKNLVNDFYYHTVWAEKKLLRGEIWTAKICVDAYLKNRLLQMIEIYEVCMNGTRIDIWHDGRMLEQWAENTIIEELKQCFGHYDAKDIKSALEHTTALFTRLSKVCAEKYGFLQQADEGTMMEWPKSLTCGKNQTNSPH